MHRAKACVGAPSAGADEHRRRRDSQVLSEAEAKKRLFAVPGLVSYFVRQGRWMHERHRSFPFESVWVVTHGSKQDAR